MIPVIFWKEWREHRWKYVAYWLVLNLPVLIAGLSVAMSTGARAPFSDLSDSTAIKYLGVALLGESWLVVTIFLVVTGFLAVATFRPELEDGSVFFVYEQPLGRGPYIAWKLINGLAHVVMAVAFAVIFAPLAGYAFMLLSGKVTATGSVAALSAVMAASVRTAVWCSLISLIAFSGSALVAALLPRWWLATAGSVLLIVTGTSLASGFFDFIEPALDKIPEPGTIYWSLGTSSQWLTVTSVLPVDAFAPWRALPLLTALLLAASLR